MPQFDCSKYYKFDELTALLEEWATVFAEVCTLTSIGESLEGRALWLLTLTDPATGPHETKPAMWVDANTHAGEVCRPACF